MITDPAFYAAAIPAVVLVGISKSGFGAGIGALATPLMALSIPVPQAAAIMLPLLVVIDFIGIRALWAQRDRDLLRLLLPAGLAGITGAITLLFLAIRTLFPPRADAPPPPRWLGFLLGTTSGFTSFVAHAGGPPIGFYLLPQKLPPITFAATTAVFFTAVNMSKWLPYWWLGLLDLSNFGTSLALVPFAPVGVWLGLKVVRRISQAWFYRIFSAGMLLTGVKLLWDGLR